MKKKITRRQFIGKSAALSASMIIPRHVLGGRGYTAPSDRINLGFIGTGRQGMNLQRSFVDTTSAQIVAASDVYKANLNHFVKQLNARYAEKTGKETYDGCESYHDYREILDRSDIDGVVIASPDHWHAVHVVHAARACKDIYCEKPLSLTIREGRAMVEATRKHNVVFQTGSMQRSWPEFRQTVELVRNGYIGEIKNIKVNVGGSAAPYSLPGEKIPKGLDWDYWLGPNFYRPYNHALIPSPKDEFWGRWRYYKEFGGGDMTDWGAHMFDIVQWALDMDDSGPVDIIPPDGNEYLFLTYCYENGITVTHESFGKPHAVRFIGTEGRIDVQRRRLETDPVALKDKVIGSDDEKVYKSENHYKDWLDAIQNRTTPICDVEIGHRTATVCTLGNIAYELRRPLKWDPRREQFKGDNEANGFLGREMRKKWNIKI